MKNRVRKCMYLAVAALLFVATGAFAQCPPDITCASATYSGGYSASVTTPNGAGFITNTYTVISTDCVDSLTATGTSTIPFNAYEQSNLGSLVTADTMFGPGIDTALGDSGNPNNGFYNSTGELSVTSGAQAYQLAAVIGNMMMSCATMGGPSCYSQSEYQDAVWFLFAPSTIGGDVEPSQTTLTFANDQTINLIVSQAINAETLDSGTGQYVVPSALYANAMLVTPCYGDSDCPTLNDPPCPSGGLSAGGCGQQEFIALTPPYPVSSPVVAAPETSESLILATNLIGLAALAFVFRRRLIRVKQ